jgi:hypothetical protein
MSSPRSSGAWRDADLEEVVDFFLKGTGLGSVRSVHEMPSRWARAVRVEVDSPRNDDVAVWVLTDETHDGVLVTWIAEHDEAIGKQARAIVETLEPGSFSQSAQMVLSVVRASVENDGAVDAHAVLIGEGSFRTAQFPGMPPEVEVEALRFERERTRASVVARVGMVSLAQAEGGEPQTSAFVLVVSAEHRKAFLIPVAERGREVIESDPDAMPWKDLFLPPDPDVVATLRSKTLLS